jgi:pyridinium-3,5-biscarboxylic acid mononucleotide synthase
MDKNRITKLLKDVKSGELRIEEAYAKLKHLPYQDLGHAKIDTHRAIRTGFPEVIYCEGKTTRQIIEIIKKMILNHSNIMATRASLEVFKAVKKAIRKAKYHEMARIITISKSETRNPKSEKGKILIISAGTSDMKVAEEAAVTAEFLGCSIDKLYDAGVAGIHRLLSNTDKFKGAKAIIVVAGMEGALASVVGGISDVPVISVPTSVGYGASFKGLAALLAMLNTCAPGVATVNIDNGFGAGVMAALIAGSNT